MNHLVLEHLSGVKGGFPLEEAYYLKLSLFQGIEYFSWGFSMLYWCLVLNIYTWICRVFNITFIMAKFSLDCLLYTFHFSIEISIELIPLELSFVVKCHQDIICHHRRHSHNHQHYIWVFHRLKIVSFFRRLEEIVSCFHKFSW